MRKVVITISQGSVVTQTVLGGLTIHLPDANFLCFISAKNYENWLRVDKFIAMNTACSFFGPHCICTYVAVRLNNYLRCGSLMLTILQVDIWRSVTRIAHSFMNGTFLKVISDNHYTRQNVAYLSTVY